MGKRQENTHHTEKNAQPLTQAPDTLSMTDEPSYDRPKTSEYERA